MSKRHLNEVFHIALICVPSRNLRSIYLYGEAWDFGEMVHNARGLNCAQLNLGGEDH